MYPLLKSLNDEWTDLVATTVAVEDWSSTCPHLSGRNLDSVLDWITAEPDTALHFLISRAHQGDSIAARTVLQTMLGKLVLVSVQSARRGLTQEAAFVDLTCQMWVTVASYPLTARPRKIAANLWMDCAKQARRLWAYGQPDRRPEQTYSPEAVSWLLDHNLTAGNRVATASADIRADDIIASACHLGLITTDAADLLQSVYGPHGLSGNTASELWGISPAAVRTRCKRAIRLLADSADQLLEAA